MSHEVHHAISYIEFGVADLAATRTFYERAFGWKFNDYGPTYSGIRGHDGEGEIGGLNAGSAPGGDGPLVLLFSTDLDATVEAVRDAGGAIVAEPYEFPGGRRFEFTDPSGNRLGVYAEQ
ncbi:glyoxalase [Pseudoclavibacter endophyticus]|uniref:VOC family protein n=1 Tax=Pseudoclavibacter endophyticus TaxID=1778590 RepID=A0A6H9WPN0_9MICO|nr:VOC family protein [Pseudoclavibacter endophyticus]KAB1649711.1 VOC family protein [Pseudoclavibacter endophyticus]GGA60361.1 glyoxalase [Pseudoclavibacter endophyticus]